MGEGSYLIASVDADVRVVVLCPLAGPCSRTPFALVSEHTTHVSGEGVFFAAEDRAGLRGGALAAWLCTPSLSFSLTQTEQVERNYIKEKKAAVKEFEDKKVELKENLIAELEEKKKMIENEKLTMELTGGMKPQGAGSWGSGGPGRLL